MKNLFIGGSSEISCNIADVLPNSYNLSRKTKKNYKKNFLIKNYSENELKKKFKKLSKIKFDNVLIFNGVFERSFLSNFSTKQFDKIFNINLKIPLLVAKLCISEKILNRNSAIYFISSLATSKPQIGNSLYAISKVALNFANKIFYLEQKERYLRFNCISIGVLESKMGNKLIKSIPLISKKTKLIKIDHIKKKFKKILSSKKLNGKNIII